LVGLAILQPDRGYAKVPVQFYKTCLHYHQFFGTPLIREGCAEEFFTGIGGWLDTASQNRSFCVLNLLSGEGKIADAADEVFERQGRHVYRIEEFARAAIVGPSPTSGAQTDHIKKSRLKSLNRRIKNLSKLGEVTVDHFSERDNAKEWLDDFVRVETTGWKGDEKTSIAENPIDADFYNEMVTSADAENALVFVRLSLGGVPIAYTLDLKCGSFAYCVKCGHDAAYRKYAPGVILEYETLKKYYRPEENVFVDSCTSPDNTMINDLWPHKRKIRNIAFAKTGSVHGFIFKSVFLLKQAINNRPSLKWKER